MPDPGLIIRRAQPGDAADFALQMSHPEVYANLMQLPMPTLEMWRKRLEASAEPANHDALLVAQLGEHVVGSAGLHPDAKLRRRHVAQVGISVAVPHQGQGVGRALMQALCDYADQWAQILRIELTVFTDNTRAITLYQAFGFRLEGTHVGFALRHGVYADVHSMARLHPHAPQLTWPAA